MVRPKATDLEEQLKRQEEDSDGSESASGTSPVSGDDSTADTGQMIKDAFGNEPDEGTPWLSGDEVNKDEKDIRDKEIDDYSAEDDEEEEDIETKEEPAESNDPFDTFGEADDSDEE